MHLKLRVDLTELAEQPHRVRFAGGIAATEHDPQRSIPRGGQARGLRQRIVLEAFKLGQAALAGKQRKGLAGDPQDKVGQRQGEFAADLPTGPHTRAPGRLGRGGSAQGRSCAQRKPTWR